MDVDETGMYYLVKWKNWDEPEKEYITDLTKEFKKKYLDLYNNPSKKRKASSKAAKKMKKSNV